MNVLEVNQVHFYILPSTIITVVIYLTLLYLSWSECWWKSLDLTKFQENA